MDTKKVRYGKSSEFYLNVKNDFFNKNQLYIKKQKEFAKVYKAQPPRLQCKNCDYKLSTDPDFTKDEIGYALCEKCGHLNGMHQDTQEFCDIVYTADGGKKYSENYTAKDIDEYNYRVATVYAPKAEFLYSSILGKHIKPTELSYLDLGCGSGHFVSALKKIGLSKSHGTEVSKSQIDFGNAMIGDEVLREHKLEDTKLTVRNSTAQVISMIGVLEHLDDPRAILKEIKDNDNILYCYLCVPTFSFSVFLEIFSKSIFHRQLSCAHTHLYTENSINHFCQEFGFEIDSEWWFGTDMVDLFRHIYVSLDELNCSEKCKTLWRDSFSPTIDSLQLEMDKKKASSEVHLLLKKYKI